MFNLYKLLPSHISKDMAKLKTTSGTLTGPTAAINDVKRLIGVAEEQNKRINYLMEELERTRRINGPVKMLLDCPKCMKPHVDVKEWATKQHKVHLCEFCGHEWMPANVATVGVLAL
jgi:hypothetical protein